MFNGEHFQCELCRATDEAVKLEVSDLDFCKVARKTENMPCFTLFCWISCQCGHRSYFRVPIERVEIND